MDKEKAALIPDEVHRELRLPFGSLVRCAVLPQFLPISQVFTDCVRRKGNVGCGAVPGEAVGGIKPAGPLVLLQDIDVGV